jgi:hypothetical protein
MMPSMSGTCNDAAKPGPCKDAGKFSRGVIKCRGQRKAERNDKRDASSR